MVKALCGRLQLLYCFFETVIQHEIEENHNQKYNPSDQSHYSSFTGDNWDIPASNTYSEHSQNFSPDIEPCIRGNRLRTDKVLIFVHLQKAFMYMYMYMYMYMCANPTKKMATSKIEKARVLRRAFLLY